MNCFTASSSSRYRVSTIGGLPALQDELEAHEVHFPVVERRELLGKVDRLPAVPDRLQYRGIRALNGQRAGVLAGMDGPGDHFGRDRRLAGVQIEQPLALRARERG